LGQQPTLAADLVSGTALFRGVLVSSWSRPAQEEVAPALALPLEDFGELELVLPVFEDEFDDDDDEEEEEEDDDESDDELEEDVDGVESAFLVSGLASVDVSFAFSALVVPARESLR
jgi:hypothetical protein